MRTPAPADWRRYDALGVVAGLWFLVLFVRYVFPPLFPALRAAYGLSTADLGLLFTLLMGSYAATQLPAGVASDRRGRVPIIAGGAVVAACGAALVALDHSVAVLGVGVLALGVGTGVHKTVAIPTVATIYRDRTGGALGVMDAAGQVGGILAPTAAAVAGGTWPLVFGLTAVVGVGLAGVARGVIPPRLRSVTGGADRTDRNAGMSPSDDGESHGFRSALAPLRDPRLAAFVLVTGLVSVGWNGLSAFLPLYLVDVRGATPRAAGLAFAGLFAVGLLQPVVGSLGDRAGHLRATTATALLAAIGVVGVILLPRAAVLAGVLVAGLGLHGFRPVRDAWLVDRLPEATAGGGLGAVRTVTMGIGAVAPAMVGVVAERASYRMAFAGIAVALLFATALLWLLDVTDR